MRNPFEDPKPTVGPRIDVRRLTALDRGAMCLLVVIPIGFLGGLLIRFVGTFLGPLVGPVSIVFSAALVFGHSIGLLLMIQREPSNGAMIASIRVAAIASLVFWGAFRLVVWSSVGLDLFGLLSMLWTVVGSVLDICAVLFLYRVLGELKSEQPLPPIGLVLAAWGLATWAPHALGWTGMFAEAWAQWITTGLSSVWWALFLLVVFQLKQSLDQAQAITERQPVGL